jgi:acyl transferase domain-containing protein
VQSFGFGGSNSHVIFDDAYNHLLLNGLNGNHNTVVEPPCYPNRGSIIGINGRHESTNGTDGNNVVNGTNGFNQTNGINGTHGINGINGSNEENGTSGVNGTNGVVKSHRPMSESDQRLLVWSAADESGIARLTKVWTDHFGRTKVSPESQQSYLQDLAHTLASRRTHLQWRAFAVAADYSEVSRLVDQISTATRASNVPKLGFVFTGVSYLSAILSLIKKLMIGTCSKERSGLLWVESFWQDIVFSNNP